MDEVEKAKLALLEREIAVKEGELQTSVQELDLRRDEIKIEEGKQDLEKRRMWFVGIGVPVTLALVAALPAYPSGLTALPG